MNDDIYIAQYWTESGDDGVLGYFATKPTEEQLTRLFSEIMPDEFEDGKPVYISWEVESMSLRALSEV